MYLDAAKKQEIFEKYGKSNTDTGSAEAQIALFSYRISHLTEHLKLHKKDYTTARSLTKLVGKRRALLAYCTRNRAGPSSLQQGKTARLLLDLLLFGKKRTIVRSEEHGLSVCH